MKIGILSLVLHSNYGGILQSYALQIVLERMGHEVVVLTKDRRIRASAKQHLRSFFSVILRNYIIRSGIKVKSYLQQEKERKLIEQHTSAFVSKYINKRTLLKLDIDALKGLDAVVVGSDQVWRTIYFKDQWKTGIEDAFLKFADGKPYKRIAYAASFGTDEWEYSDEETKECARLLKQFDAVSVREKSGIKLCTNKLCCSHAHHVLDPTLLLTKEDYVKLINNSSTNPSKGNLMCYVLDMDTEKQNLIERISMERGLTPFYANSKYEARKAPLEERIQPPVEQWLRGFMDAKFVVTDSFHACVFSIIFNKPFVVVGNKERGMSRFKSLLSMFSLEKNCICSMDEYDSQYSYSVSTDTYSVLKDKQTESIIFLKEKLK